MNPEIDMNPQIQTPRHSSPAIRPMIGHAAGPRTARGLCGALLLTFAALATTPAGLTAQKPTANPAKAAAKLAAADKLPARIWRDPGPIASLNMVYGIGGKAHAPDPAGTYTFVKEDLEQTSPKFVVTDAQGVEWKVKLGEEPQSETAATRFLWAAGYFVDEDYYLAEFPVKNMPKLERGQQYVSDGIVHRARLERKLTSVKKLETWSWFNNPFSGQRELNGLRVMMSLLNNWDLKEINNSVYAVDGERHYVVSDAGATFGSTGNALTRSKSVPKDYAESKFIAKTTPGFIDFVLHSRPFFLDAPAEPGNYSDRTKMEQITKHIPRADAKWLGERLAMLSDVQIRDAFRTSGYEGADLDLLVNTIKQRIAALKAL
jgi:hypothetical protein